MAPEHRFPAGADDAIAAYQHLCKPDAVAGADVRGGASIAGFSAGGCLTAVVQQACRDRGLPLRFAAMLAPMIQYGGGTKSYVSNGRGTGSPTEIFIKYTHAQRSYTHAQRSKTHARSILGHAQHTHSTQ
jgi:acetyl esterase/lipase